MVYSSFCSCDLNFSTFISSIHSLSCVWLFATPWTVACQAFLSITNPPSLLKLMSIKLVMPSNLLISSKEWVAASKLVKFTFFFCFSKLLQSCPTLCDPIDGSHQAPPSLGFSRQEYEALNKTFFHFDLPFSYFGTKTFFPPTLLSYLGSLKVFRIWSPVWQGGILGGGSVQILILEGGDENL